jgi:hypothetical protein
MICYINLLTGELIEFANAQQMIDYLVDKNILKKEVECDNCKMQQM